ncbi:MULTISPECIES: hypothetical protein [Pseudoalteromonas]|uniref:hypothetical protein n=1 Tax=Pseudoalteromonas TaxID=53246 RepID=UPI0009755854|nr:MULTISPECIES: hypothetical protein [unclassified Pseudoalteromonas]PLT24374.1 hypothetical protein CXF89_15900 [Pseudoalteromonas sp. MelDa3]|tara:strand:+ start:241 stop:696 length:456 start_codon:yes stop_codon:yes gene_type:complete
MNKTILIIALSMYLAACGGGDSETTTPTVADNPTSDPVTSEEPAGMASLEVAEGFDLSTKFDLDVDVNLGLGDVRAYLNICQKKTDSLRADYNNCLFRSPLSQSAINTALTMSRQDIELVAEIWFYDNSTQPLSFTWVFDDTKEQQLFEMR